MHMRLDTVPISICELCSCWIEGYRGSALCPMVISKCLRAGIKDVGWMMDAFQEIGR